MPWIVRISLSGTEVFNGEEKTVTKIGSVATVVACGLLSGCADVLSDKMSTFGPDPVIESESFQRIDLAPLLYPEGKNTFGSWRPYCSTKGIGGGVSEDLHEVGQWIA